MLAKKILAGIFAVIILLKLIIGIANPNLWMGAVEVLLGQHALLMIIYLVLLAITGYYVFSTFNMIDLAVVMLFTSLLTAISILPYSALMLKLREEIISIGMGKAWFAVLIWGALAVAVLYRVFSPRGAQPRKE
jgi:hypothetical protein